MDWFVYKRDLRYERFKTLFTHIHRDSGLTFCKAWFAFFCFFVFYLGFLSPIFMIHRTADEWRGFSLYPVYHFHPLHRQLDINWVIATESSPLRIAGNWNRTWNFWYMLFRIHPFNTCRVAAAVRRMLKNRVTLGNISRVLSNLTKKLIFAIIKDFSSLPMLTQLKLIFSF